MAETSTRPTPAPWKIEDATDYIIQDGPSYIVVAHAIWNPTPDAALIVAACNACQLVNPQNPQAVATGLVELVGALKAEWNSIGASRIRHALASIETQETLR